MGNLTNHIIQEIAAAIRKLGGNPNDVDLTDTLKVNRVLKSLGADRYVLMTIGSWRDTLTDEEVLRELREICFCRDSGIWLKQF